MAGRQVVVERDGAGESVLAVRASLGFVIRAMTSKRKGTKRTQPCCVCSPEAAPRLKTMFLAGKPGCHGYLTLK